MKNEHKKNIKLVNEIMLLCFKLGADNINIDFKTIENKSIITINAKIISLSNNDLKIIKNLLSTPRRKDMEEYYWNLNGDDENNYELSLVGMMTDEVHVDYHKDILYLKLIRIT